MSKNKLCFGNNSIFRTALIQIKNEVNKEYNAKNEVENKISSSINNFGNAACVFYFMQPVFVFYSKPEKEDDKDSYPIRNKLFQ
ncbi:MAG: hypothetical protein M3R72_04175 [Bacteroidota bacterium]|nr:hypothetical protein [Bacteroidota bacterium]